MPSPAAWLLPEFQDLSSRLTSTLDLPALAGNGVTAEPTGDGFLLWLPTSELPGPMGVLRWVNLFLPAALPSGPGWSTGRALHARGCLPAFVSKT